MGSRYKGLHPNEARSAALLRNSLSCLTLGYDAFVARKADSLHFTSIRWDSLRAEVGGAQCNEFSAKPFIWFFPVVLADTKGKVYPDSRSECAKRALIMRNLCA